MSDSQRQNGLPDILLDKASSMLAFWDTQLICQYANAVYQQWFGLAAANVVGMHLRDLLGADLFRLNEIYVHGVLAGTPQVFERTLTDPTGALRHVLARYHPMRDDEGGAVTGFIAEVVDVTPLKQLQMALQEQCAMHQRALAVLRKKDAALEAAQRLGKIGSWEWEIAADITTWSPELYRLFGCDPSRLPPRFEEQAELFVASSWRCLCDAVDAALASGRPYMLRLQYWRPGSQRGWMEVRGEAGRDGSGAIVTLRGTAQDVTLSHQLVDALSNQTERLKLSLAAAQLGLVQWDGPTRRFIFENRRAREVLGVGDTFVDERALLDRVLHPDDSERFRATLAECEAAQLAFFFCGRILVGPDRQLRWIEWFGRFDGFENGRGVMIGTVADITARTTTRQALCDANAALVALGRRRAKFQAVLGHELRNCLAPLAGGLQTLSLVAGGADTRAIHAVMARQLSHMGRLVDDVLDVERIEHGKLYLQRHLIEIGTVVAAAVAMARPLIERRGHGLTIDDAVGILRVNGDIVRLTQALVNVLNNAAKFTPAGGRIALTLRAAPAGHVSIDVSDNGIGLLPEQFETVFGAYVQIGESGEVVNDGLGIGLHLVRQLLELHGGSASAASAGRHGGSTFTLCLPLAGAAPEDGNGA